MATVPRAMLKSRWGTMKTAINGVNAFIDKQASTPSGAVALNRFYSNL